MKSKKQSPIWPYLGILACLFVLSVTAPRAWDRIAHRRTETSRLSEPTADATAVKPVAESTNLEQADDAELKARDAINRELLTSQPAPARASIEPATKPVETAAPGPPAVSSAASSLPERPPLKYFVPPAPEVTPEVRPSREIAERRTAQRDEPPSEPTTESPTEPEAEAPLDETPAQQAGSPAPNTSAWPLPRVLVAQLTRLAQDDPSATWAGQAHDLIRQLCRAQGPDSRDADDILKELRNVAEGDAVTEAADPALDSQIARTRYALARWLDVWESAADLEKLTTDQDDSTVDPERMDTCLAAVEALLRKNNVGSQWHGYLCLEALGDLARPGHDSQERRTVARKVLDRLSSTRLSSAQQKFVQEGPLKDLKAQLRAWAAEPVTAAQLLAHLEQYESSSLPSDARLVGNDYRGLYWWSPDAAERASHHLDTHYRNANLRIAVSGSFLNRLVPQPEAVEAAVNDTVVNVPVSGRSTTFTRLSVRLIPDPRLIRLGFEAHGRVDSDTVATSGPAKFYNEGRSTFLVRKLLLLGPRGLHVWPAVAEADNDYTYLVSMETDFDGVPLVGPLVRSIARTQHDDSADEARMEVETKVAVRARDQFDAEVDPQLIKAAKTLEQNQLLTLRRLGLDLVPVSLATTEQRVVARMRLGCGEQLGAHTPRPRAPSDSWFSLQLHQSALNNGFEQLDLEGRKFALPELFQWVAKKLNKPQMAELEDLPAGVRLSFAKKDAVRVRCENGKVEVTFALAELTQKNKTWRDFTVRALYMPVADGLSPRFVRDDSAVRFDGRSLKGKSEPVLRAIFAKVLSRNRPLTLLDESTTSDRRMEDLQVTQFTVEDGWIGLAYSPQRGGNVARRPKQ